MVPDAEKHDEASKEKSTANDLSIFKEKNKENEWIRVRVSHICPIGKKILAWRIKKSCSGE